MYKHVHLCALVSHAILDRLEWGNQDHKEKICFVSFFHDICISSDQLEKISSNEELDNTELTAQEYELVNTHALQAGDLALKMGQSLPFGADEIIRQHHASSNGLGFSESISQQISPLAQVFIVAEEYVHNIMEQIEEHGKFNKETALTQLNLKFNRPHLKKIMQALSIAIHGDNKQEASL